MMDQKEVIQSEHNSLQVQNEKGNQGLFDNERARIPWTDLEFSVQYLIFTSFQKRNRCDDEVASKLGLTRLEQDLMQEKIRLKEIYPAHSDHIRQYCEAAGWDAVESSTATLMTDFSDYLAFATLYELASDSDIVKGKVFLRQRGLDQDILTIYEKCDKDETQPVGHCPPLYVTYAKGNLSEDGNHMQCDTSERESMHADHKPSKFAAHFNDPNFPIDARRMMLEKSPFKMDEAEVWLVYGREAQDQSFSRCMRTGKTEVDQDVYDHTLRTEGNGKLLLGSAYLQFPALNKLLKLHNKYYAREEKGDESLKSLSSMQFEELVRVHLQFCATDDAYPSHELPHQEEKQSISEASRCASPKRPVWSPISNQDGAHDEKEKEEPSINAEPPHQPASNSQLETTNATHQANKETQQHKLQDLNTQRLRFIAEAALNNHPLSPAHGQGQTQDRGANTTSMGRIAKPRMKRGPYKKTRERLAREEIEKIAAKTANTTDEEQEQQERNVSQS